MIRYTLTCDSDHRFDSWFQSSTAFETVAAAGHLSCAVCGSGSVKLALMAPSVRPADKQAPSVKPDLKSPASDIEAAMDKLRREVEAKTTDVGQDFAKEARRMHDGDAPERAIRGVAGLDDAKKLLEDGVPVVPLPFLPKRKAN